MAGQHWSYDELGRAELGDKRRTERLVKVAKALSQKPGLTIGGAMDVAGAKAAYRLFNEPDVTPEAILAPHQQQALARIAGEPIVLVAQDTTVLNYSTHEEAEGFGGIGGGYSVNQGCFLHSALAFNEAGVPQGILALTQLSRATKSSQKESVRWAETVRQIALLSNPSGSRLIHLADQEGDDWSLLSACAKTGSSFVIRADGRRVVKRGQSLGDVMGKTPLLGTHDVSVSAKKLRKGKGLGAWSAGNDRPASAARTATVGLRAKQITLPRSANRSDGQTEITLTVVSVVEVSPPAKIKDPLVWYLMTDEPVTTLDEALKVVGWYRQRWAVETWHRTLKSGIKVEECRLANYERMQRFIVLAAILAWRIDWMVQISREQPDTPVEALLDPVEIQALQGSSRTHRLPLRTVRDGLRQIAMLGGFTGAKRAGEPGSKTVWSGWRALMERVDLLQTLEQQKKRKDVGRR